MIKPTITALAFSVLALAAFAKPGAPKLDPVAPGYPNWIMPSDKDVYSGRVLSASDLRHKVVIVVYVDAAKLQEQFAATCSLITYNSFNGVGEGMNWPTFKIKRNCQLVYSVVGKSTTDKVKEALKPKNLDIASKLNCLNMFFIPIASGLTYAGAPEIGVDDLPYVAMFGPKGAEPALKGKFNDVTAKIKEKNAELVKALPETWKDFYGSVDPESKNISLLSKTLKSGKPVDKAADQAKKLIKSKDEAVAEEGQIVYDAIQQTLSDLSFKIKVESRYAPYCAAYDLTTLFKYWPSEKKKFAEISSKCMGGQLGDLSKAYINIRTWTDPEYDCKPNEAKKNLNTIKGWRKKFTSYKENAKDIPLQNAALLVDVALEEAEAIMESRASAK